MENNKRAAVTIGKFDGLHTGHMKLINIMMEKADKYNLNPVVFSFFPPPDSGKNKAAQPTRGIYSKIEKIKMFEDIGASYIEYPFNEIKDMVPEFFIKKSMAAIPVSRGINPRSP